MKPKISVIVPVYKVEKFIDKSLNSLVNQTLEEIEIIIINDGSPDNSEEIINKYIKNYPNKIIYHKIENGGVANARNVGLKYAKGEYIGFCDSDDYADLDMYESLYDQAILSGSDVVCCGTYMEDDNGKINNHYLDDMSYYPSNVNDNPDLLLISNPFITNKIFSRELIEKNNIQFKKYKIFEDLLFTYSTMIMANKVDKVNHCYYHYIRRENESVTGTLNNKFFDLFPVMNDLREIYEKNAKFDYQKYLTFILLHHSYLRFTPKYPISKIPLKVKFMNVCFKFYEEYDKNWRSNFYFKWRDRQKGFYKSKIFWVVAPYIYPFYNGVLGFYKRSINNYGCNYIKYQKKSILTNHVFFESQKGNDINGNMFYLIKTIREDTSLNDYVIDIAVKKNRIAEFNKKLSFYNIKNYNLVVINSKKYIEALARDKYLFTDTSFTTYFKKREGQVYLNTWHGTPLKYLGKKVAYEFYDISNVMKNFITADYILYPNNFMKEHMVEDYMLYLANNKIVMGGYPRNSIFFTKAEKTKKQRIGYLPTWRGTKGNMGAKGYIENLKKILSEIDSALTDNQEFYMNLHPYLKGKIDVKEYNRIKLFDQTYETYDFLNTCDVLITDYSSVFFDFACTKRKIILFPYDHEDYLKDRGMYLNIIDLPFPKVYNVKDLIEEINSKKFDKYNKFNEEYCFYDSKNNARELIDLALFNQKKDVKLIDNFTNEPYTLIESNSFSNIVINKEIENLIANNENIDRCILSFRNDIMAKEKDFLIRHNYNFFGYFDYFPYLNSMKLRKMHRYCDHNNKDNLKFNHLLELELERRIGYTNIKSVLVYKEKDNLNIGVYSMFKGKKIIVLDNVSKVNLNIISKYDMIYVYNDSDAEYLKKNISASKIFLYKDFDLNKITEVK